MSHNNAYQISPDVAIHQLFELQVLNNSHLIAIQMGDENLSYQQLNERANALAIAIRNTTPQSDVIGISTTRSIDTIISLLAILKAGKAYLPLDPSMPYARLKNIIGDAFLDTCIAPVSDKGIFKTLINKVIVPEENVSIYESEIVSEKQRLAYIIYTSGSTGKPKGVGISHSAVINLIQWHEEISPYLEQGFRTLQFSPLSFDVSVMEIFCTICSGGTLVLVDEETRIDPLKLLDYIEEHQINRLSLPFVALQYLTETADTEKRYPSSLQEVITAGEQLKITPHITRFFQALPDCVFYNMYGPTEATVFATALKLEGKPESWPLLPSIGKAVANSAVFVLSEELKQVPVGKEGELCISGINVACGYINNPELTAEKFIDWTSEEGEIVHLYRTGDLCRLLSDNNIEFLGRKDTQVKIRGNRVELGEIEAHLNHIEGIQQCVVIAAEDPQGQKRILAYLISSGLKKDFSFLRNSLADRLPDYMIPSLFIWVDSFEKTGSGKIDRKSLPLPDLQRPELSVPYSAPISATETRIAGLWAELLQLDRIGRNDNFFELGGNSLLAVKSVTELKKRYDQTLPITRLYQSPTVHGISSFLGNKETIAEFVPYNRIKSNEKKKDIAVIGMSMRFPGASNMEELWEVLTQGKETISFFTDDQLDESISQELRNAANYVKARGIVENVGDFDANFFGIPPNVAELMDPQQRIFLELAWEALENSGHIPEKYSGKIGVFAGSGNNTYYTKNVLSNPDLVSKVGDFLVSTLNEKDYIATRAAYELNLNGPAVSVHAACSTSLLAIVQAAESIRNGQCDVALAGGSSVNTPVNSGHLYQQGTMLSGDGHCRSFDAKADGTIFSDGAGIVVLKALEEAQRDGDVIYAVLKGVGLNNDGHAKASFTAPSTLGQAGAIAMAINDAGVDPASISYVEAHGTGTILGDPIEVEGLKLAFGKQKNKQFCAIGSIKSNMGHLVAAAGVAGFIKTVLSLYHQQLPATLFYDEPNPNINFENSPFFVNDKLRDWTTEDKRIAGVSSFGVGGTNVHVVLEEYLPEPNEAKPSRSLQLISWSAKTRASAGFYAERILEYVKKNPDVELADIAWNLHTRRADFKERNFIVAANREELVAQLNDFKRNSTSSFSLKTKPNAIVFMFPGQGSQYANMGLELYQNEKVFSKAVDECLSILNGPSYQQLVSGDAQFTQTAIFVTSYAISRLWISWGIMPTAFVGHSVGEFVAAHFAGIFSLSDALKLITERTKLVGELSGGSMLSVRMDREQLEKILPEELSVAVINTDKLCVVAGETIDVDKFYAVLKQQGVPAIALNTSHAFHSTMMEPIVEKFESVLKTVKFNKPFLPIVSTVTGSYLTDQEAVDPRYWAQHIRKTVRFDKAVNTLSERGDCLLLEAGPGRALTTFAIQQAQNKILNAIGGITQSIEQNEYRSLLKSAGQLWLIGVDIDWTHFYEAKGKKLRLPSYAFDHKKYWVTPNKQIFADSRDTLNIPIPQNQTSIGGLLEKQLKEIFEDASGIEMKNVAGDISFAELGFDSLLLTQIATNINKIFKVQITFRKLFETLNSIDRLSAFLDENYSPRSLDTAVATESVLSVDDEEEPEVVDKPFGAAARIEKQNKELIDSQQSFLSKLIIDYNSKTSGSKNKTQESRSYMADPRVVSGFKPMTKELVYPIIVGRSKGSRLWDIDGNEYVDALNGFGSNMFGYQPEFIKEALHDQIDKGYEIGPQHELAGEVSKLLCEFTGFDRAGLCNTGSEAVLGAMRIARSITGKQLIVAFSGSYHGIIDEVIVRGTKKLKSIPAASGIMPGAVQNMLILDYGTDESLKIIEARAHEIAAVLVEPVQSRRPEFQPVEFLQELRTITTDRQIALVFDEVITGFRMHPGGAQALFDIKADLATYGKVIGGGLSIGVIAGIKAYMDALDGGYWKYGDASMPEVGVTYFAGTFVRHPLALASTMASLLYMKQAGNALQEGLTQATQQFILDMDAVCKKEKLPLTVVGFGSLWRLKFTEDVPYSELLFTLMRLKGIHILDGFPCFMTTAHTSADIAAILKAFKESVHEMINAGFFNSSGESKIAEQTVLENALTVPSTESQVEIWTSCLIGGVEASCAYNDSASIELTGEFDEEAMGKALQVISDRHESLRAVFSADGQQMIVNKESRLAISTHDLTTKSEDQKKEFIAQYNYESATTALDLVNGPLFKATLFKLSDTQHMIKLLTHHIICDGWSVGILMQEMSKVYSSFVKKEPLELPPAPLFSDYARTEHHRLNIETEKYWLKQFKNDHTALDIPTDNPRPAQRTYKSKRVDFNLDAKLVTEIKQTARKCGSSFVTTMLAAFEVFLQQLTGQEEIIIGLPAAGQSATGKYGLVGHCVNLLPLKSYPDIHLTFSAYLKQRSTEVLDAYDHHDYTYGTLLKKLNLPRDPSRLTLIPVIFNIDIGMDEGIDFYGLKHRYISNPREYETFEIFLNITDSSGTLTLEWSYNTELFDSASIEKMIQNYESLLNQLVNAPDIPIRDFFSKIDDEKLEQLRQWNNTACFYPENRSLHELISETVVRYPDHTALTFKNLSFTYLELNAKANQLAALLLEKGLKKGDKIAVALDRSAELVIGILAIMKIGGIYVPLDPRFPVNRINYMLEDSGAILLLTSSSGSVENTVGVKEIVLKEIWHKLDAYPSTDPEVMMIGADLLYILYTSGSTGLPKGVMVAHHNVVNFLYSMQKRPGMISSDKLLAVTTISFDIAALELFLPLISGAEIVLADDESIKDGRALLDIIKKEEITIMQATPYTWRMLLEAGWNQEKIKVICGGEALPLDLAKEILKHASSLWNVYGPTETTIWSTITEVKAEDEYVSIGRPIDNTSVYLLDRYGNPVGTDIVGEIYIGGAGVAKGYLNKVEMTFERFIADSFSETKAARMYRTGDLARFNKKGDLIYISRIDQQVKIRGYRIETAEIEHFLCKIKEIKEAVVMSHTDRKNINKLIAFVVLENGDGKNINELTTDWRKELKTSLPEYMLPDNFSIVEEIPLTPNGKIDRKLLLNNQAKIIPESQNYQHMGPRTDVEQMVADIWEKHLGIENIGIHDNFFELGGHSLTAVQVMAQIEKETGKRLPLAVLFEKSTVEKLALTLNMDGKSITWDSLVPIKPSGTKIPIYIVHGAGLNVLLFNTLAIHMAEDQPVYGLQAKGLNGVDEPLDRIEDIAAHYISAIRAQNPDGPYALAGYSFGGIIAFEMAKQLEAQNKEVKMLAMFDTYAYRTPYYDPFLTKYINKGLYFGRKMWYSLTFKEGVRKTFAHRSQAVKRMLTRVYWKLKYGKQQEQEGFFGYANKIDEKNDIASRFYQLKPYDITIEVFSAQERSFYVDDFEYMGWKPYALRGVNIHKVPGEHNTIFKAPNDKIFAEVLQECLDKIND